METVKKPQKESVSIYIHATWYGRPETAEACAKKWLRFMIALRAHKPAYFSRWFAPRDSEDEALKPIEFNYDSVYEHCFQDEEGDGWTMPSMRNEVRGTLIRLFGLLRQHGDRDYFYTVEWRCCTNIPAPSSTSWLPTFYNATDTGIPIADILFSA